jgi:hypothetical protein
MHKAWLAGLLLVGALTGQAQCGDLGVSVTVEPRSQSSGVGRSDPSPNSPSVSTSRERKPTITGRQFGDAPSGGGGSNISTPAK